MGPLKRMVAPLALNCTKRPVKKGLAAQKVAPMSPTLPCGAAGGGAAVKGGGTGAADTPQPSHSALLHPVRSAQAGCAQAPPC